MAYDNTNSGALFKNERKETEKQPDYTGKINIEGKDYNLAAWLKTSEKSGKKFMSLKATEPKQAQSNSDAAIDDDVPF